MKKLIPLFALACITIMSCHNHNNLSITCTDSNGYYSMNANFSKSRTRAVERYLDSRIGALSNMSFVNTRIDGKIALDDHTTFYIKKYPGHIKIKFDKD